MTLALDTLPDNAASLKARIAALYADSTRSKPCLPPRSVG